MQKWYDMQIFPTKFSEKRSKVETTIVEPKFGQTFSTTQTNIRRFCFLIAINRFNINMFIVI